MPEPAEIAREDQNLAAARHAAECTVRFWQVLIAADMPHALAANLTAAWLGWWLEDDPDFGIDEDEGDDDDDGSAV